jgi:hypothetical protein
MSRGLSESLQAPARPSRRSFACQSLPQLQCCCSFRVYRYSWSVSFISGKRLRRSFGSVGTPAHVGIRLGRASESATTQAPPIGARIQGVLAPVRMAGGRRFGVRKIPPANAP